MLHEESRFQGGVVYEKEKDSLANYDSSLHYVLPVRMFTKGAIRS